jgi:hypothetical protein
VRLKIIPSSIEDGKRIFTAARSSVLAWNLDKWGLPDIPVKQIQYKR